MHVDLCLMPVYTLCVHATWLLESFLADMGKRILKLLKWASNSAVNVVMGWYTMKVRLLVKKLITCSATASQPKCDCIGEACTGAAVALAKGLETSTMTSNSPVRATQASDTMKKYLH